jgi:hypothetical protein
VVTSFSRRFDDTLVWREDHHHVAAIKLRHRLDLGPFNMDFGDAIKDPLAQFRMGHFAPTEHDGDLHLVSLGEELADLAGLGVEITVTDLRAVLHLLYGDGAGFFPGFLVALLEFVKELRVIEDLADRRVRCGRDLDEIELNFSGERQCLGQGFDSQLGSVVTDQANLTNADAFVDAVLWRGDSASLLARLWVKTKRRPTPAGAGETGDKKTRTQQNWPGGLPIVRDVASSLKFAT